MQHERLSRFSSILAIFLFAMSALSFFKAGTYLFGFIILIISFLNVIAIVFLKDKKKMVNVILNALNAVAAGIVAYDYVSQGTSYIQYVWMLTTLIFLTLSVFLVLKKEGLKSRKR
jgi:hypothetical protein